MFIPLGKWRVLSFPFIIFHAINIPFDIAYYCIFVFAKMNSANGVAVAGAVLIFAIDVAMSVVLIAIAYYMQKDIKLQSESLVKPNENL